MSFTRADATRLLGAVILIVLLAILLTITGVFAPLLADVAPAREPQPTPTVVPSQPEISCATLSPAAGRLCVQASPAEGLVAQVEYCGLPDPSPDFLRIVPADATGRYTWAWNPVGLAPSCSSALLHVCGMTALAYGGRLLCVTIREQVDAS